MVALIVGGLGMPAMVPASPVLQAYANSDFNNDGRDDLAIGVPGESVGSKQFAGAVNVLYGSSSGLAATGNQFWTQDSSGVEETAEDSDQFGRALG
jgi:hypothetical protein